MKTKTDAVVTLSIHLAITGGIVTSYLYTAPMIEAVTLGAVWLLVIITILAAITLHRANVTGPSVRAKTIAGTNGMLMILTGRVLTGIALMVAVLFLSHVLSDKQ